MFLLFVAAAATEGGNDGGGEQHSDERKTYKKIMHIWEALQAGKARVANLV